MLAACGEVPAGPPPPILDEPVVLRLERGDRALVVEAILNGDAPRLMVVDSGLSETHLLDANVAESLGLPLRGLAVMWSWAGLGTVRRATLDRLGLGGVELRDVPVAVVDLPPEMLAREGKPGSSGLLGQPLFDAYAVTVDVPAGTLTLSPPGGPVPDGAILLPLLPSEVPLVELLVDGQPVRLSVDTGAIASDITLYEDAAARLGLPGRYGEGRRTRILSAGGELDIAKLTVDQVQVGPQRLPKVEVDLVPRHSLSGLWIDRTLDGVVGLGLLAQYRFTLDIPAGRLVLVPLAVHDGSFWDRLEDKSAAPE